MYLGCNKDWWRWRSKCMNYVVLRGVVQEQWDGLLTLMSLLIRYTHIPFYFRFSFTFSTSLIHHYTPLLWCNCMQSCLHSLHRTDLTYLMGTWFTIHMYLLLFLVSSMCLLLWSNQSWAFALHGQVLGLGWALYLLSCFSFIFNLPVFTFRYTEKPQPIAYTSFPQNWDLALTPHTISHLSRTISHRIALLCNPMVCTLHHTWRRSLAPRSYPLRAS